MLSPSRRRSGNSTAMQLVNKGETSPCLLINPVFTITANNWAAACDAAATRRCYPKVRQKSKSSGASPSRQVSPGRKSLLGEEFINIITSQESVEVDFGESVYEDYGSRGTGGSNSTRPNSFHSNPYLNTYYGSSRLLQVPSTSTLLLPHNDGFSPDAGRQQRSSSITVPIQHNSRGPERSCSEVFIRRCSSASPKGRYTAQQQQQQECQRLASLSNNTSPGGRGRGYSLTITQLPIPPLDSRRASYSSSKRRRSSHSHHRRTNQASSSSSSSESVNHSHSRRGSHNPRSRPLGEEHQLKAPPIERQRTLSMPAVKPLSRRNSHKMQVTTTSSGGSGAESSVVSKKKEGSAEGSYDVVIIGSPNVGKSTCAEYFNIKGGGRSSGSDQGIGSDEDFEEDSYEDQDLAGGKAILFRPQGPECNFYLRIFCQQISAVTHLYKYDAVIILYSVTDRDSFEFARKALNEILPLRNNSNSQATLKKVVILVGNKSDLERSRCVSPLEGRLLATAYDVKFIEVSSSLDVGITELKKGLAAQIYLRHKDKLVLPQQTKKKAGSISSSSSSSTSSTHLLGNRKGSTLYKGGPLISGLSSGKKGALNSLRLAQKLIDRIMSLRIGGGGSKSKSCLDLHSL